MSTVDWYLPLKVVHVLSAIVAVGTNVTYFVWLAAMKGRAPTQQAFALETIRKLDARLANPAYAVLPLTGVIMVLIADGLGFTTFWIAVAIGLYLVMGAVAIALYSPTLKRQIAAYEAQGAESAEFQALGARGRMLGILLAILVVAIIILMVVKPSFTTL
jgi:uncharacterized membrane protein